VRNMDFTKLKEQLRPLAILEDVVVGEPPEEDTGSEARVAPEPEKLAAMHEPDYLARGFNLDVRVEAGKVVEAAGILDEHGFFLEAVTGVDWPQEGQLEVVYDYCLWQPQCRVVVRTRLDRQSPVVPTISTICPGANWHERETHDFFGIEFSGHPDLRPLLLPDDADFHPLLKDFKAHG